MTDEAATLIEGVFSIAGRDFDPDECSREVGLEPTRVWRQRHVHLLHRTDLPNVAWELGVGPEPFDTLDDPVRLVLGKLGPSAERIVAYAARRQLKLTMTCLITIHAIPPAYVLSPETMRQMVALNAEFTMDIADLRPSE
jgi:hypothetical protein